MTTNKKVGALLAAGALIAIPTSAFAQNEVTDQAGEVAEQAERLQQEANVLATTANETAGANDRDAERVSEERDDNDDDTGKWGLLGLLGLAGLMGLKKPDRDHRDHRDHRPTGTGAQSGTQTDSDTDRRL